MRDTGFWRSGAFRTAMLAGGLFVVLTVMLLALVYEVATGTIEHQVAASVEARARALEQALDDDEGEAEDLSRIVPAEDELFRYVEQPDGRQVIADVVPAEPIVGSVVLSAAEVKAAFKDAGRLDDSGLIGFGIRGRDGGYIFVGEEDEQVRELREALFQAGFVATGIAILASFLMGWWIALRNFRRIERLNAVAANVMNGDMAKRMPVSARRDEIDLLAGQLNRMLAQLESVMGAIRQVTNDIAHDMRTPLSRLQRKLEQAQCAADPDQRQALLDGALNETGAMLDMFGAMLRIAQIEGGELQRHFEPFDLSAMLDELAETYLPVFSDGGRMLEAEIAPGIEVMGDRALVQQLFSNLLDNAVVHTPPSTLVSLSMNGDRRGWQAAVSDNGPGISPEHRAQIFDRFYRADASRSIRGSGLGLALVRAIVEAHEWALSVTHGMGLKIEISFPPGLSTREPALSRDDQSASFDSSWPLVHGS